MRQLLPALFLLLSLDSYFAIAVQAQVPGSRPEQYGGWFAFIAANEDETPPSGFFSTLSLDRRGAIDFVVSGDNCLLSKCSITFLDGDYFPYPDDTKGTAYVQVDERTVYALDFEIRRPDVRQEMVFTSLLDDDLLADCKAGRILTVTFPDARDYSGEHQYSLRGFTAAYSRVYNVCHQAQRRKNAR